MEVRGAVSLLVGSLLIVTSACSGGGPRDVADDDGVVMSTPALPAP